MQSVLSSTSEAELAALFHNAKDSTMLCTTLADMKHPQPPPPSNKAYSASHKIPLLLPTTVVYVFLSFWGV
jgi:hypothetical protein